MVSMGVPARALRFISTKEARVSLVPSTITLSILEVPFTSLVFESSITNLPRLKVSFASVEGVVSALLAF